MHRCTDEEERRSAGCVLLSPLGPPMTDGSLSRPPDHLDAPLRLPPSLACRNTMLCTPAQGRCAAREPEESTRRALASGLAHLYRDTEPRSVCGVHACMHASSSTQISAFDDSQWTLARVDGWTDARSGAATGHTSQPRDWTGYDSEAGWPWEGMDHGLRSHRRVEGSGDRH
jgi:hypothetical protein